VKVYKTQFSFVVLIIRLKRYTPVLHIKLASLCNQEGNGDESKKDTCPTHAAEQKGASDPWIVSGFIQSVTFCLRTSRTSLYSK